MGLFDRDADGPRPAPHASPTPGAADDHAAIGTEQHGARRPLAAAEPDDATRHADVVRPLADRRTLNRLTLLGVAAALALVYGLAAHVPAGSSRGATVVMVLVLFALTWAAAFAMGLILLLLGVRRGRIPATATSWFVGVGLVVLWGGMVVAELLG